MTTKALRLFPALFLAACGPSSSPKSTTTTGPKVTAETPASGASGVLRNLPATVTFDRAISPATLTPSSFYLDAGAGPVTATVSLDAANLTATLTPSSPLPATSTVTGHVTTAVKDSTGAALAAEFTWTFQTGATSDTTPPAFGGITGAADDADGTATLSWSAATDDNAAPSAIVYTAYEATNLTTALATITGATSLVTPPLPPGTWTFTVRATDQAGNQDTNTATKSVTITIPSVSFANDIQPIFTSTCALNGCHKGMAAQQGLDLSATIVTGGKTAAYTDTVNVTSSEAAPMKRVAPSDATNSYLYRKITGDPSITGTQMPGGGGAALPAGDIAKIRNWILAGAPYN